MKNLILLLFLALSINAFSQIEKPITKGNIMLSGGGNLSYGDRNMEYYGGSQNASAFTLSITPGVSYFIADRFAIGLNVNLAYDGIKYNKSYTLGIGPKIRYYFTNGIFLNAAFGYNHMTGISNTSNSANYFSFKPGIGYSIFLNQKVSLDAGVFYEITADKYKTSYGDGDLKTNTIMFDLALNIFL